MSSKTKSLRTVLAGMFLALALTLPFLTAQLPQLGHYLAPMHVPVLLCGFFCGPVWGLAVGFVAPLLRFFLFGMPPIFPTGIAMCFELAAYGFVSGALYKALPEKKPYIYVSLIGAMLAGRLCWGAVKAVLYGLGKSDFGVAAFVSGAFIDALPAIAVQIIIIPVLVMALKKYTYKQI